MDGTVKGPKCPRLPLKCRKDVNCKKTAMIKCSVTKLEYRLGKFEKNMTDYMPRKQITEEIAKMKEGNKRTGCELILILIPTVIVKNIVARLAFNKKTRKTSFRLICVRLNILLARSRFHDER